MNDRLAETIAVLANVRLLSSGQLRTLELLARGYALTKTDSEWSVQDSSGVKLFSPFDEQEIRPLQAMGYMQETSITDSGREAFKIYKTAHPLLFD